MGLKFTTVFKQFSSLIKSCLVARAARGGTKSNSMTRGQGRLLFCLMSVSKKKSRLCFFEVVKTVLTVWNMELSLLGWPRAGGRQYKKSDLPDSNQRPKDLPVGFLPTTVLRSTN
ncbi:Uncharacterized protein TCM_042152 [Theobroma cacao]|uniref:Uncharacterized protein n=1 Tax=Theobroma cacao TaxID=3641 RepID=A0A061GYA6_THECC|nr:Uncharacterized protein TCM_042152 [Theobroma cacao]